MKTDDLRWTFTKRVIPELVHTREDLIIDALNVDGSESVKALLMELWADLCTQDGDHVNNHPLQLDVDFGILEDEGDNSTYLLLIEFPELKKVSNLAKYMGVCMGNGLTTRLFVGETDYQASKLIHGPKTGHMGRQIFLIEFAGPEPSRTNLGAYSGDTSDEEKEIFISAVGEICQIPRS